MNEPIEPDGKIKILPAEDWTLPYLEDIYMASFPESERRPWNKVINPAQKGQPQLLAIMLSDDMSDVYVPVGLITLWDFENFVYVEHYAVGADYRGGGLGGIVLDVFVGIITNENGKPMVLEVEPPSEEYPMARRRIDFYRRHGFELCDYEYIQPPYTDSGEWLELKLMKTAGELDLDEVTATLHRQVYEY